MADSYRSWLQNLANGSGLPSQEANALLQVTGDDYKVNSDFINDPYSYTNNERGQISVNSWDSPNEKYWYGPQGVSRLNDIYSTKYKGTLAGDPLGTMSDLSGGGGSSQPDYSQEDLAYLDAQQAKLFSNLGRTDTYLNQALDALLQNYNKEKSAANLTRSRNLEDFDTKTQISEQGRGRELDKNDSRSRMLANSLRQRIGLASGSGSSAYQVTAPKAVQRQASENRSDILQDYSANFQALDTNKRRSNEDFEMLLSELDKQKLQREGGVRGDIEEQRNSIRENQARVAGQRAQLLGGGYNGVRAAMQPYEEQINNGNSLIDSIYNKYAAKYNVKPLEVRNTNLRDYGVDKLAVRDQQATGQINDYAPYKPFNQDDEEQIGF